MTTDKKIEANRQNTLQGTGSKIAQGKATGRQNAIRHGILSRKTLLPKLDFIHFESAKISLA